MSRYTQWLGTAFWDSPCFGFSGYMPGMIKQIKLGVYVIMKNTMTVIIVIIACLSASLFRFNFCIFVVLLPALSRLSSLPSAVATVSSLPLVWIVSSTLSGAVWKWCIRCFRSEGFEITADDVLDGRFCFWFWITELLIDCWLLPPFLFICSRCDSWNLISYKIVPNWKNCALN